MADIRFLTLNEYTKLNPDDYILIGNPIEKDTKVKVIKLKVKDLVKYLIDDGSVVLNPPNAGVDSHQDLQNILGDGVYHISLAQLEWIRSQMYAQPSTSLNGLISTLEVGNFYNFNGFLQSLNINNNQSTNGQVVFNSLVGSVAVNNSPINTIGQSGTIQVSPDITAVNTTSTSVGNYNIIQSVVNENNPIPNSVNQTFTNNYFLRFLNRVIVFQSSVTDFANPAFPTQHPELLELKSLTPGDVTTSGNSLLIYSNIRSNNFNITQTINNQSGSTEYLYIWQPSSFPIPQMDASGFGFVPTGTYTIRLYNLNDSNFGINYTIYRGMVNPSTPIQINAGSPITVQFQ
jgi:hypothetical protein